MIKTFSYAAVTLQPISSYAPVVLNRQVNQSLAITPFTVSLEAWAGASRIFALQKLNLPGTTFSIRAGQVFNQSMFFICVKWVSNNIVKRYKIWNPPGALLSYPVYAGEIIPATGAYLEYWSTSSGTTPSIGNFNIITDILEVPSDCCSEEGTALANGICVIGPLSANFPPAYPLANFYVCVS